MYGEGVTIHEIGRLDGIAMRCFDARRRRSDAWGKGSHE